MRPHTKPTPKQIIQMDKELKRLLSTYSKKWVQNAACVEDVTIRSWLQRGRISASAADKICGSVNSEILQSAGFTRESLRPDVVYWYE